MKRFVVGLVVLIIFAAGVFVYWTWGNLPANANDKQNKIFVIEKGAAIRQVGNSLKKEGLIRDPVVFFVYIKLYNQDKQIQAGDYRLSPSMPLSQIIDQLNHGTLDRWVTIPEGYRAEEIADVLAKNIPSYKEGWRGKLNKHEGYLFPDTYLMPRDADIDMVISIMRDNFNRKIKVIGIIPEDKTLAKTIILASLVEREAVTSEEKPLIAGIINNRLEIGMKLDIDATIQYAKGNSEKWWPQITPADYKSIDSLYNTYLYPGLPPDPIANPGIEAIKAALNPKDTPYLYYLHAAGKIYPAKTFQEHQANIKKHLGN